MEKMDAQLMKKIRRCIHFFYALLLSPKAATEDRRRQEFILNIILIGSLTLAVCLDISLLHNVIRRGASYQGIAFWKFSLVILFFAFLYLLSKRGYICTASYAIIAFYYIIASWSSYRWGVSLPSVLLIYALIITISGILISSRFAFAMAIAIYSSLSIIARIEIASGRLPTWRQDSVTLSDIFVYSVILLLITLITWLSNREIAHSLRRARKSEQELILEKESLEIRVEQRTAELRQAQAEKMSQLSRLAEFGRLSSGLFHDLVSPLSTVVNNLHDIRQIDSSEMDHINDQLDRTIRASRRMGVFISSIKKQIRSDELKELFALERIIEEAIVLFSYRAIKNTIAIELKVYQKISLFGNPIKFHQIVSNLISNALDAYDTLSLGGGSENKQGDKKDNRRVIKIYLKKQKNRAELVVIDHGCGIGKEILPRIFDQFFTTKPPEHALGLGLSTTKDIVEKEFNGSIEVASDKDEGTKFTVTIPLV